MGKLIIHNKTSLSDYQALQMVTTVVNQGRISNDGKQYCYVTTIQVGYFTYAVITDLNKHSDKFTILDYHDNN